MTAVTDRCSDCTKFASTVDSQISQLIIAGHIWSQAIRWRAIREQPSKQRVSLQLRWSLHHWISNCDGEEYNYQTDKASKPGSRWVGSTSVDPRLLVLTHCVSKEPSNSISSVTLSWRRQSRSRNDHQVPSIWARGTSYWEQCRWRLHSHLSAKYDFMRRFEQAHKLHAHHCDYGWTPNMSFTSRFEVALKLLFRERHPPGKELTPHTDTIISAKIGSRMSLETFAHATTVASLWQRHTNVL